MGGKKQAEKEDSKTKSLEGRTAKASKGRKESDKYAGEGHTRDRPLRGGASRNPRIKPGSRLGGGPRGKGGGRKGRGGGGWEGQNEQKTKGEKVTWMTEKSLLLVAPSSQVENLKNLSYEKQKGKAQKRLGPYRKGLNSQE